MREIVTACLASFALGGVVVHGVWRILHNHADEMWRRDWDRLAKQLERRR